MAPLPAPLGTVPAASTTNSEALAGMKHSGQTGRWTKVRASPRKTRVCVSTKDLHTCRAVASTLRSCRSSSIAKCFPPLFVLFGRIFPPEAECPATTRVPMVGAFSGFLQSTDRSARKERLEGEEPFVGVLNYYARR